MKNDLGLFSARDLRSRSSELVRDAEQGRLSVITKRGKPAAMAVPFSRRLVDLGLDVDLAVHLLECRMVTLAKAAKIAGLTLDAFMDRLSGTGTVAVDYPGKELAREMEVRI
jgi:prevent-host-death family protein